MIFSTTQAASRPFAIVLSLAFVAGFWLPTISTPAHAADTAVHETAPRDGAVTRIVIAAPAAPALM